MQNIPVIPDTQNDAERIAKEQLFHLTIRKVDARAYRLACSQTHQDLWVVQLGHAKILRDHMSDDVVLILAMITSA